MSIFAKGTNDLRRSDMELEAVIGQVRCGAAGVKS